MNNISKKITFGVICLGTDAIFMAICVEGCAGCASSHPHTGRYNKGEIEFHKFLAYVTLMQRASGVTLLQECHETSETDMMFKLKHNYCHMQF